MKKLLYISVLVTVPFLSACQEVSKDSSFEIQNKIKIRKGNPLMILDGIELKDSTELKSVNPNDIESMEVLNETQGLNSYGRKGINGVVLIRTKDYKIVQQSKPVNPLYILDNLEVQASILNDLNPNEIEKVEVFKGEQTEPYGEKGRNGVVVITKKKNHIK
jgi:outer membrane receptor for ferrienterochelin and colicin